MIMNTYISLLNVDDVILIAQLLLKQVSLSRECILIVWESQHWHLANIDGNNLKGIMFRLV